MRQFAGRVTSMTFLTKNLRAQRRAEDHWTTRSRTLGTSGLHGTRATPCAPVIGHGDVPSRGNRELKRRPPARSPFPLSLMLRVGERQRPRSAGRAVRRQLRRCGASSLGKAARRLTHGGSNCSIVRRSTFSATSRSQIPESNDIRPRPLSRYRYGRRKNRSPPCQSKGRANDEDCVAAHL